jgi:hypothetical protein
MAKEPRPTLNDLEGPGTGEFTTHGAPLTPQRVMDARNAAHGALQPAEKPPRRRPGAPSWLGDIMDDIPGVPGW